MLLSLENLLFTYAQRVPVTGILHVGAHLAEEAESYHQLGVPVWWVEANPAVMGKLNAVVKQWPTQRVIQALVTDQDNELRNFNVTNYDGMSSSVFQFQDHPKYSPDTVFVDEVYLPTRTIDSLVKEFEVQANFLNLDIQGAELLALQGATRFLRGVHFLYTEVSTGPVYRGGAQRYEIDAYLPDFERVATDMGMHAGTHGDAFYRRVR